MAPRRGGYLLRRDPSADGQAAALRRARDRADRPAGGDHGGHGRQVGHWLRIGEAARAKLPRIFYVNWFRKSEAAQWLWPGFGDDARVLKWVFERVTDKVGAVDTPIGSLPKAADLDVDGLDLGDEEVPQLLRVDLDAWLEETESIAGHLAKFGDNLPPELTEQLTALRSRVNDELAAHPEHAP